MWYLTKHSHSVTSLCITMAINEKRTPQYESIKRRHFFSCSLYTCWFRISLEIFIENVIKMWQNQCLLKIKLTIDNPRKLKLWLMYFFTIILPFIQKNSPKKTECQVNLFSAINATESITAVTYWSGMQFFAKPDSFGLKTQSHLAEYFFPIVHDRDKFSNREQSERNWNDENAMCDYLSKYLRMCFLLYEDLSRPFLNILQTLCKRSKIAED